MEKRTKYLLLLIGLLCLVSMCTYGYSYARYVSNYAWNYYLGTKGFYFSSSELGINKVTNVNNNWGFESTYFTIRNSENDSLVTDYDIQYTVKCTILNDASSYSKCLLNGTNYDTFTGVISSSSVCRNNINQLDVSSYNKEKCESEGYEWYIQENYKDLYFDIVKTGDKSIDHVNVLVEVTSTSPYTKTLIGEFNLSATDIQDSGLKLGYKEFSEYSRVIVSNSYDEDKCVKLSWDSSKLRIDYDKENVFVEEYDDNNNIKEINFNINRRDSISYIFYKTDFSKIYDVNEFNLIESSGC